MAALELSRDPRSATGIDNVGLAVRAAAGPLGTPDLVVHVPALPDGPTTITNQSTEAWAASCEAPMVEAIGVARSVGELTATSANKQDGNAPRLVWILPTTALGGAAGYVGVGAAGEAIRALAKGVAKQWGHRCTTTVLAVSPTTLFDGAGPDDEGSLSPPALGRPEDTAIHVATEIASLVDLLADPRNRATTGATVVADGGIWMAP